MATRAHIVLPDDLMTELDTLVGPRGRSEYIANAIREKLLRERQRRAITTYAGVLADEYIPEWATPELTSEWINGGRRNTRSVPPAMSDPYT